MNYAGRYLKNGNIRITVQRMAPDAYLARILGMSLSMSGAEVLAKLESGEWKLV